MHSVSDALQKKYDYHAQDQTSDMHYHFDFLAQIALNCDVVVELGVRSIVSTWALLMGLSVSPSRWVDHLNYRQLTMTSAKKLISYDINHPKEAGGNLEEVYTIAKENEIDFTFIQEDTLKIEIPDCHCIFFDTDHTYKQLSQELELHANKANRYLVFHDTTEIARELVPAINEFLEKNEQWNILKIEGRLAHFLLLQFSIENNSGAQADIETAFMRLV